MTTTELDEIMILHWRGVMRRAMQEGDPWVCGFVRSIARAYKRPEWRPSPKQEYFIRHLVREARSPADAPDPIEILTEDDAA